MNSGLANRTQRSYPMRALRRTLTWTFRASFLEPVKWLIQLAGMFYSWIRSRAWASILIYGLPAFLMLTLLVLDWRGSRIEKKQLSQWYLELGESELGALEESFDYASLTKSKSSNTESVQAPVPPDHRSGFAVKRSDGTGVSRYGEMLFRRVHLLSPSEQSYFVIGLKLLEGGEVAEAQRVLRKIAPDDQEMDRRAHGVMAAILLDQIAQTADESLFATFQHHASAGANWRFTPAEVLAASAEMYWHAGDIDQAFKLLNSAAENRPEFFLLYFERAQEAGLQPLAESIRDRAIFRFQRLLAQNPQDVFLRSQLAALESTSPDGLIRAEQLLREGEQLTPSPVLSRALSEVYLVALKTVIKNEGSNRDAVALIDRAMAADPSNPNLPLSIKELMKRESKNKSPGESSRQLVSLLNQELVTGKATTGTHAMLAEHYLGEKSFTQAIVHLEQVFRIAPTAAKYSNDLAELYISAGRLDDALNVANRSLSILSKRELLAEKHVDDLLENLGYIYQKLQNWEEAVPALELCLSFSPERPQARYRLAEAYRKTGKHELAEEQEKLAAATELTANRRKTLIQKLSSTESLTTMFREMEKQTGSNDRPEIQPLDFNTSNPESPLPAE